jgi:hypothetical protein
MDLPTWQHRAFHIAAPELATARVRAIAAIVERLENQPLS